MFDRAYSVFASSVIKQFIDANVELHLCQNHCWQTEGKGLTTWNTRRQRQWPTMLSNCDVGACCGRVV